MKKRSFRTRLLLTLCLSVFSIAGLMIPTLFAIYYSYQRNDIDKNNKARHEALDETLTSVIEDANSVTINLFSEDGVALLDSSSDPDQDFSDLYHQQPVSRSLFEGISYYRIGKETLSVTSDGNTVLPEISKNIIDRVLNDSSDAFPISYCLSTYNDTGSFLILGKKVKEKESACFLFLNGERLMQIVDSVVCLDKNLIIDSKRNIVLSDNTNELGALMINGFQEGVDKEESTFHTTFENEDSYLTIHSLTSLRNSFAFSWQIVSIQDYDDVFGPLIILTYVMIALTCATIFASVLSAFVLSKRISRPLVSLSYELEHTDLNQISDFLPRKEESHDEIGQLETSYHEMVERIHELMEENMEKMNQQRVLELESLQMQINPHFLYNTLDTISWLSKINGQKEIDALVMSLAKFFRLTLHSGDKIIQVKEELEITEHYLEIQKTRFPERFDYEFAVDPTLSEEKTLKLILQPIVENSVKYGFDPEKGKMKIQISTKRYENYFEYCVKDDGIGFKVPENLFEKKKNPEGKSTGFGLYNVQERIHLEYGDKYGMTVTSQIGKGTKTIIRIPLPNVSPLQSHQK